MNHVKEKCLKSFTVPSSERTLDDWTFSITIGKDETIYSYGGEEFREPTTEAVEATVLATSLINMGGTGTGL